MSLQTYNDYIARWAAGYRASNPIWGEQQLGTASNIVGTGGIPGCRIYTQDTPAALPTGVTAFIPTRIDLFSSAVSQMLVGRLIKLGELDISGASGTFTDGSAMPSITELGVSRQIPSAVIAVVKTALNATPGSFTFTYTDQDGNTGNVSSTFALTASCQDRTAQILPLLASTLDTGVIDITAASRTAGTTPTGVLEFFGMIPIAKFGALGPANTTHQSVNLLTDQINAYRLGINETIGIFHMIQQSSMQGATIGVIQYVGDN